MFHYVGLSKFRYIRHGIKFRVHNSPTRKLWRTRINSLNHTGRGHCIRIIPPSQVSWLIQRYRYKRQISIDIITSTFLLAIPQITLRTNFYSVPRAHGFNRLLIPYWIPILCTQSWRILSWYTQDILSISPHPTNRRRSDLNRSVTWLSSKCGG